MARVPTSLVDAREAYARMEAEVASSRTTRHMRAMYSSAIGAITTDASAMVIPIDDHMVHRGHGVFDTAIIRRGNMYQLRPHVERIARSAQGARIGMPWKKDELADIVMDTAAASGVRDGYVRYWITAGGGGFGLAPEPKARPGFYCVVYTVPSSDDSTIQAPGIRAITSSVPMKPPPFSTIKSNNYLPNVLHLMEAMDRGCDQGIWIDEEGHLGEGPNMNIAILTEEGDLLVPPFDKVLAGITVIRVLELLGAESGANDNVTNVPGIKRAYVRPVPEAVARKAKEIMMIGSGVKVTAVVEWDGKPVGDGNPGPVALALEKLIEDDKYPPSGEIEPIAYDLYQGQNE